MPGELKEETFPYYYTSELTEKIKIRFVPNYANNTILFLFIKDNEQKNRYYIR